MRLERGAKLFSHRVCDDCVIHPGESTLSGLVKKIGPQGVHVWLTRVVQVELLQLIFFIDDLVLVMNCIECCKKFFLYKYREIFTTV